MIQAIARNCCLLAVPLMLAASQARDAATDNPLQGRWFQRPAGKAIAIDFLFDGTLVSTKTLSNKVITKRATYKILDGSHVRLVSTKIGPNTKSSDIVAKYVIKGRVLTMKYPNGTAIEFDKAN